MRTLYATILGFLLLQPTVGRQADYAALYAEAEQLYAEQSFAMAHGLYVEAGSLELEPADARWVEFRTADTLWRARAGSSASDPTDFDNARRQLETIVTRTTRVEERDRIWAEAQQSLGDFWWTRRDSRNWGAAWPAYEQALDWWAGARDIDLARERYLGMVWTMAAPRDVQPRYYYGYYGNRVPLAILENTLEIAGTDDERAHAHYLIAMTLRQQSGDWRNARRVSEEFEAALGPGKASDWYDDALYHYAEWLQRPGRPVRAEDGQWRHEPDHVATLELCRRIRSEFRKGETQYWDQAGSLIEQITKPVVGLGVFNFFLPGSEIPYHLSWRNASQVEMALHRVDLTRDVSFLGSEEPSGAWLQQIDLESRQPLVEWRHATGDTGKHVPASETLRLDRTLEVGAYVLHARVDGVEARELVLVTDASIVLKTSGKQALVYVCNVLDGSPLAEASVRVWRRVYVGRHWIWNALEGRTGEDGLAVFDLGRTEGRGYGSELFVAASLGDRQALSTGRSQSRARPGASWKIYAFTDRPAYRPGDRAQWKLVARRHDGSVYSTPAGQKLEYEVRDPQGAVIDEGVAALNQFGSAWGSLELSETMPLGEYRVQFWTAGRMQGIGAAQLFRLEEYKLPEFRVAVVTPEEEGRKKAFRLGETIEVTVEAEYYFGGPVADATVEVLVHQTPFHHRWFPPHKYPWLHEQNRSRRWSPGGGQIVKRETLRTGADGRVTLSFETPPHQGQDFEYRVEARVTDSSRREIVGSETVRVTRQRYYVYPRTRHNIHRPQDEIVVDFKTLDANDGPLQASGTVTVTRDRWHEIWRDPESREISGPELKRAREGLEIFPPPAVPGKSPWSIESQGYRHEPILSRTITTDESGEAVLEFTAEREGFYRIAWSSEEPDGTPIAAETTAWVATPDSQDLGYRHGGVEIIVDRDTFATGQRVPVMLSVPTNDRYVLFTVEAEQIESYRLVHIKGTVKLIELEIDERHVPNVYLSAAMVSDRELFEDTERVVVPPESNFLDVELQFDREIYEPGNEGMVSVLVRDQDGRPVRAEVSLGVADDSVYAIQQDYAGDPRQFFFGSTRPRYAQTHGTLRIKQFAKLVEGAEDVLIDAYPVFDDRAGGGEGGVETLTALGSRQELRKERALDVDLARAPSGARADEMAPMAKGVADEFLVGTPPPPDSGAPVEVRSDFRATAYWQPDVVTAADGRGRGRFRLPDSLTSWRATARVASAVNQFGSETTRAKTQLPLIVRLQAPRFFVVGDTVTVSASINNNTPETISVRPSLVAEGVEVHGRLTAGRGAVDVPPGGESRVDWRVSVAEPGEAKLTVEARGETYSDAMERKLQVYEHGLEKLVSRSGKLRGSELELQLQIPRARKPDSTTMTVQVSPTMAATMLDALPYLADYPYGCTEQTMSRFLPAAITAKTLDGLGLDSKAVAGRLFGGIVPEHVDRTHPEGRRDLRDLDAMIDRGLDRIYDFQHADGGWGWWKGGASDHYMTAYVVWGLALAREAGVDVRRNVAAQGAQFLEQEIVEQENRYDIQAWMFHALATHHASSGSKLGEFGRRALDNLWTHRADLNAYARALTALGAHHLGQAERARTLVRNLGNGVEIDRAPDLSAVQRGAQPSHSGVIGTAHWGADGLFHRWSEGGVETTAFALRALLAVDPQSELIEPVTNWLIRNRRGAQWSNTRDTAIVVLALNDYLRQSGELSPDTEVELFVNGESAGRERLTAEDALAAPTRISIDPGLLRDGVNRVRLKRRSGDGPVYYSVEVEFFSLEEPVTPVGNEIFVRRQYFRMVPRPTLLKGVLYDKVPLDDGQALTSGERVEAVVTVEAKNDYEYLVFEDLKPAGLEAVEVRSGQPLYAHELRKGVVTPVDSATESDEPSTVADRTGRSRWVYQELRDRKVALFIDKLPQGVWELRYELRAETPGRFHALPVMGHAMYVPEIRCNGSEIRIEVLDRDDTQVH